MKTTRLYRSTSRARSFLRIPGAVTLCLFVLFLYSCATGVERGSYTPEPGNEPGDRSRLENHVRALSERYAPRDYSHPGNLNRAARYIEGQFARSRGRVEKQEYRVSGDTYANIICSFGPEQAPRIVIGAHYDSYENSPGADDNASGVAGLIELAYLFGSLDTGLPLRIDLVAYGSEEPPLFGSGNMGSDIHAGFLAESGIPVRLMISLDQIGYFDTNAGTQRFPDERLALLAGSDRGDFIAVLGTEEGREIVVPFVEAMKESTNLGIRILTENRYTEPYLGISDCRSYLSRGIPSILVTDTAPFRGDFRHSAGDIADTLDYSAMRAVVLSVASAVLSRS